MVTVKYEILVLGLGNLLMSDDGLGIYVVEQLKQKKWPPEVLILEAGTSPMHCLEEISHSINVIAVDAVRAGGKPGTVLRLAGGNLVEPVDGWRDAHGFSLPGVIELAKSLTGFPANFIVYGVEPLDLKFGNNLSPAVIKALPKVTAKISKEIATIWPLSGLSR